MEIRPKLKLQFSTIDKTVEVFSYLLLIAFWVFAIIKYLDLPAISPSRDSGSGLSDGKSVQTAILFLPIIASVLFIGLSILNKFPEVFNYPTKITPENAPIQYKRATRLVRYLKLIIVLIFGLIVWEL